LPATAGTVTFDNQDVFSLDNKAMRSLRRRMQIIFQDPMSSLNPRMSVANIVAEPLVVHSGLSPASTKTARGRTP